MNGRAGGKGGKGGSGGAGGGGGGGGDIWARAVPPLAGLVKRPSAIILVAIGRSSEASGSRAAWPWRGHTWPKPTASLRGPRPVKVMP